MLYIPAVVFSTPLAHIWHQLESEQTEKSLDQIPYHDHFNSELNHFNFLVHYKWWTPAHGNTSTTHVDEPLLKAGYVGF